MNGPRQSGDNPMAAEPTSASSIEQLARRRLAECAGYRRQFQHVTIHCHEGVLTLRGCLPSFHLKQLLQTHLLKLRIEGVRRIDNQVEVTPPERSHTFRRAPGFGVIWGIEHIRNARELLDDHETPLAKRLLGAGAQFLEAMRFDDDWPTELRTASNQVKLRLLAGGDIAASIRAMDPETLDQTAEELVMLAKEAERLAGARVSQPS